MNYHGCTNSVVLSIMRKPIFVLFH